MNILTRNLVCSTFVFGVAAWIFVIPRLPQLTPQTVLPPILLLHAAVPAALSGRRTGSPSTPTRAPAAASVV
jgi:hypothetical protein